MIELSLLEKRTIKTLEKFRWYKGRNIDVTDGIEQLTTEGYICFPYARSILEEFAYLRVGLEYEEGRNDNSSSFDFDFLDAGMGDFEALEFYETVVGEKIYPIGNTYEFYNIYVGESKKMYMIDMEDVYLIGNSIEELLNNLVIGSFKPIKIN